MQPKAFTRVSGLVHLDEPIIGATVSVYDLEGVKVFEQQDATHTTGSFVVDVAWGIGGWGGYVPNDFKIVATGGTIDDEPFTGSIVRMVHNHREEQYYHLNAISTLIAGYLDKHPMLTYHEASEAVKDFLGVPEFIDMDLVVDSSVYYNDIFDHTFFMLQAEEHADFDKFIDTLLEEIDLGGQRVFFAAGGSGGLLGSLLGMVGTGLLHGVIHYGTEQGLGFLLRQLGYKDTDAKIDEISEKMDMLLAAVQRIEKEIGEIKTELEIIEAAIKNLETDLKEEIAQSNLVEQIGIIDESFEQLHRFSKDENVDKSDIESLRDTILRTDTGVLKAMNVIHAFVKGESPLTESILETLTEKILLGVSSYEEGMPREAFEQYAKTLNPDRTKIDNYLQKLYNNFEKYYSTLEGYFSRFLLIQVKGVNLIVEAYLYKNQTVSAKDYIDNIFLPRLKGQTETFMDCVDTLVFNVHPTPMAEFPNMGPIPEPDIVRGVYKNILDNFNSSRPYIAKIYPRADYLVDKVVKSFSGEEPGVFKARVLLSMLKPSINRESVKPVLDFSPQALFPPAPMWKTDTLVLQRMGSEPGPHLYNAPLLDEWWSHGQHKPIKSELRKVTIRADAPSRWALPKAIIDKGFHEIRLETEYEDVALIMDHKGKMDDTVPYQKAGIVHYYVFDFGWIPGDTYYRILTWDQAKQVNEGTGWVMDRESLHELAIFPEGGFKKGSYEGWRYVAAWHEGYFSWPEYNLKPVSDVVIYLGFDPAPYLDSHGNIWPGIHAYTVVNPWKYHLYNGYWFSRSGFIKVNYDEDGDPYGYWGGYWRQESPA